MTVKSTASDARSVPYVVEGEGPVALVLIAEGDVERDGLGVVAHYLAEEAGFHVIRIGARPEATESAARIDDVVAVMDLLGLDHAWIGGHGAGGTLAHRFVDEHHERSNGLLLLGVEHEAMPLPPVLPVLIVQATHDDVTPPANGERLQATAPERASIKTIDGADHLFPATHPIQTAIAIEEYLDWD